MFSRSQIYLGTMIRSAFLIRFIFQGPEMLPYQPNSESCLIGCYSSEEGKPKSFPRQVHEVQVFHQF